jgi:hypothetical protein
MSEDVQGSSEMLSEATINIFFSKTALTEDLLHTFKYLNKKSANKHFVLASK